MPNRFYIRQFLNRPGFNRGAYVLASVEDSSRSEIEDERSLWHELEVADCSRRVILDFPLWSHRERRNSLHKARLLLRAVEGFVAALEEEAWLAETRAAARRRR